MDSGGRGGLNAATTSTSRGVAFFVPLSSAGATKADDGMFKVVEPISIVFVTPFPLSSSADGIASSPDITALSVVSIPDTSSSGFFRLVDRANFSVTPLDDSVDRAKARSFLISCFRRACIPSTEGR